MKTQPNPLATSPPTFDLQGHISVECELSLLKDSSIIVRTGDDDSQCRICLKEILATRVLGHLSLLAIVKAH